MTDRPDDSPAADPAGTPAESVRTWQWRDEDDTRACAAHLAQRLRALTPAGDAVIELVGPLGAGKTTFVRHLLRALGVIGRIKSPSYAIVEPYELPGLSVWHFDFYRFGDPREWEDAGFRELFASPGLKLVEWPDKVRTMLPVPDLHCRIDPRLDAGRDVSLSAGTPRGRTLLDGPTATPAPAPTL